MRTWLSLTTFAVPGSPSGFGEPGGRWQDWRERCRDVARTALQGTSLPVLTPIKVQCRFLVLRCARAHDIDNLLKPLLDAIGAAGMFPEGRTGGAKTEWNRDDGLVYAIEAEKELVEEGALTEVRLFVSNESK